MEEYVEPGDPGSMGPGAGAAAGLLLLVVIAVATYLYSRSLLATLAVVVGLLAIGLLLNAAYDRYVL
jgi:hypothetical protein